MCVLLLDLTFRCIIISLLLTHCLQHLVWNLQRTSENPLTERFQFLQPSLRVYLKWPLRNCLFYTLRSRNSSFWLVTLSFVELISFLNSDNWFWIKKLSSSSILGVQINSPKKSKKLLQQQKTRSNLISQRPAHVFTKKSLLSNLPVRSTGSFYG